MKIEEQQHATTAASSFPLQSAIFCNQLDQETVKHNSSFQGGH
jgi:hypothetical protein